MSKNSATFSSKKAGASEKTCTTSGFEGAEHNEAAWAQRVGPFLQFLFPAAETKV